MTQPTGDHASGVKLASAYVEVTAKTRDGMKSVHDELTGIETHAKQVGDNSAQNIVTAVSAAGEPAARGFTDKLRTFANSGSKDAAEMSAMSFGQTFKDAMSKSRLVDNADWLFNGFKEKSELEGAAAAESFHGRFIQLFAAHRLDAENEAEKTGAAMAQKIKAGAESVGEGFGLGESFKKASEGLHGLGGKFGEAGEAAGGLGEKLGGLAAPLAMFASPEIIGIGAILGVVGGVGEIINKVNELGDKWEELGHRIEIQTGATGEHLEALKDQVKGVYGSVTNSMGDVQDIVSVVNTAFKDSGQGAQAVSTQVANLQAMIGAVDTTSLGTAFKGFNIGGDATQQQSVIDGLLKTSQDSQVPVNNLIESLQRLAPIADQAHLSMKDSIAMLDEFAQAGIKPQQTMYMLAHASSQATKEGKDFRTVLQQNIDAIRNAPNEQEAESIAKGIAGPTSGRGGAALLAQAVRGGGQLNLDPAALSKLENWDGLVNKTRGDTMTWGDQWTIFKHKVSDALEPVSEELHGKVQGAMNNVVSWLTAHQDQIVHFATSIVHGFEEAGHWIGQTGEKLAHAFGPEIEAAMPSIRKLGDSLGPMFKSMWTDVEPILKALGAALGWAFKEGLKELPKLIETVTFFVNQTKHGFDEIHDVSTKVVDAFKDIWNEGKKLGPVFSEIGHVWHEAWDPIVEGFKQIVGFLDKIANFKMPEIHMPNIHIPGFQSGGRVRAQDGLALGGFGGGDIIPALLEPGEHVLPKEDVSAAGGHGNIMLLRALIRAGIMPDVLGSMTGLGVAAIGAGYRDGGPVGFATGGPVGRHAAAHTTKVETGLGHHVDSVLDGFVNAVGRTTDSVKGVNDSLDKLKGGDVGGGIDGLTKSFKNMQPVIKDVNTGLSAAKNNLPSTISKPDLSGRPSISGIGRAASSIPHGWEDIGRHIERGRGIAEQSDQVSQQLGVEGGIPWLQAGAQILGQAKDLHDTLSAIKGYVHGHDQPGHQTAPPPHTFVGTPHQPGAAHAPAPAHVPQHQAEPQRKPGGGGGGVIVNTLPIIGSIQKNDEGKYHSQALDSVGDAASHTPGAGVLDNIFQKAPAAAGDWVGKKLSSALRPIDKFFGGLFRSGGPIFGPGIRGQDSVLIGAAPDEHVIPVPEVDAAGGHDGVYRIRAMIRAGLFQGLEGGGPVGSGGRAEAIDSFVSGMQGTPYSQGSRNDCSGLASQICNVALGLPPRSSMFTTRNEGEWLAAHGFIMGNGPEGSLRVGWYNHGSAPDDGHTAVTLPDGRPAESGGSHGNFMVGGGAAGASNPEFDHHAYLPMKISQQGPAVGGSSTGADSGGGGFAGIGGSSSGSSGGGGGGGGGGGAGDLGSLGDIVAGGLRENMIPGFSDPTQWGLVKSASAFMKFLGSATGAPGSPLGMLAAARGSQGAAGLSLFGDLLSGSGSGVVGDITGLIGPSGGGLVPPFAQAAGGQTPGYQPSGDQSGGGTTNITHNANYYGDINDHPQHQQAKLAADKRTINQTLQTQRLVTA